MDIKVSIPFAELRNEHDQQYVTYMIKVEREDGETWMVDQRFSNFVAFDEQVWHESSELLSSSSIPFEYMTI
jgi:hypothetical protein